MRDIDIEARCWNKNFSYRDSNDKLHEFREGDGIGKILRAWVEALLEFNPEQRKDILEHLEIWGQPRAWTDEKIAVDTIELISEMYEPQALTLCDCLGAQWTEQCLLTSWLKQVIWAPYAPGVTSTLQEPDSHEHAQLKA